MDEHRELRVLFLAISYAPVHLPSDKQFLNDLIYSLSDNIIPAVWTLTESTPGYQEVEIDGKLLPVTSRCRIGHHPISRTGVTPTPHPYHSALRQLTEISLSVLFELNRSLRQAIEHHNPDVIHCYDNIGPLVNLLKVRFHSTYVTCGKSSARTSDARGWEVYRRLLRATYSRVDRVVAYTESCRGLLLKAGLSEERVVTIPWGGKLPGPTSHANRMVIRQRYGCLEKDLLIVVLPRGSVEFVLEMVDLAKRLTDCVTTKFVFAIRPTRYCSRYDGVGSNSVFVENGPADYLDLLATSDAAWAPMERQFSTSLPPLAWIETMARGTPIVTPKNPGVEECVVNGQTGVLYQDNSQLSNMFEQFHNESFLSTLSRQAIQMISMRFNAQSAARKYEDMWRLLVGDNGF